MKNQSQDNNQSQPVPSKLSIPPPPVGPSPYRRREN